MRFLSWGCALGGSVLSVGSCLRWFLSGDCRPEGGGRLSVIHRAEPEPDRRENTLIVSLRVRRRLFTFERGFQ